MALKRLSTEHGARLLLQRLIDTGRCQLEDFDQPSPNHANPEAYRNLLRDADSELEPKVELINPRDFQPANDETPLPF